jgi:hypothetical protein
MEVVMLIFLLLSTLFSVIWCNMRSITFWDLNNYEHQKKIWISNIYYFFFQNFKFINLKKIYFKLRCFALPLGEGEHFKNILEEHLFYFLLFLLILLSGILFILLRKNSKLIFYLLQQSIREIQANILVYCHFGWNLLRKIFYNIYYLFQDIILFLVYIGGSCGYILMVIKIFETFSNITEGFLYIDPTGWLLYYFLGVSVLFPTYIFIALEITERKKRFFFIIILLFLYIINAFLFLFTKDIVLPVLYINILYFLDFFILLCLSEYLITTLIYVKLGSLEFKRTFLGNLLLTSLLSLICFFDISALFICLVCYFLFLIHAIIIFWSRTDKE